MFGIDSQATIPPEAQDHKGTDRSASSALRSAGNDRLAGASTAGADTHHNLQELYLNKSVFDRFGMNHEGGPQTAFNNLSTLSQAERARVASYLPEFAIKPGGDMDKVLAASIATKGDKLSASKGRGLTAEEETLHEAADGFANLAGDPKGTWELRPGDMTKNDKAHNFLPAMTLLTKMDHNIQTGGKGEYMSTEQQAGQAHKLYQVA